MKEKDTKRTSFDLSIENSNNLGVISEKMGSSYSRVINYMLSLFLKLSPEVKEELSENLYEVRSPMVGTFYKSPSPDAEPYVNVGDTVKSGATICIIEAMKLMNEIQSDIDGIIAKVFVENAQPVEYGQPLFGIKV